jgi:hypothetical protein
MNTNTLTRAQTNWLDASTALAFQGTEFNRLWERTAREALGPCVCGKPGTHVFADEESDDWACRVPVSAPDA